MTDLSARLSDVMFPVVLVLFLALYIGGILAGTEPEFALARAGIAGVVLAGLTRVAIMILDATPKAEAPANEAPATTPADDEPVRTSKRGRRLDVAIGDEPALPVVATQATTQLAAKE